MKEDDPKRYTTKCTDCGDTLKGFRGPKVMTCQCGKTSARDGTVSVEGRVISKTIKQDSLFNSTTDYLE